MMEITIKESPFGDSGKTYQGALGMMQHFLAQLKSYRGPNKTKEGRDALEADILGYEIIVKSGKEENALKFLEVKHTARQSKQRFKDNIAIVEHMKNTGEWK